MMDEDLYGDVPEQSSAMTPEKHADEEMGRTTLMNKSAFKGELRPGMVHRVEIVRVGEDEVEVRCLGMDKEKMPADEDMMGGNEEGMGDMSISSMME